MNKNLIEDIVSDCGYQALGLYEYLYCNRDEKYNVTVINMWQMVNICDYHNEDTLVESIEDLKEFGYLKVVDNIYLFPKSTENYDAFFELFKSIENITSPNELSMLKEEDIQLVLKVYKSRKEDIGVKISQKLLTKSRLRNDNEKTTMSGYEYLVMTILYKYIKPKTRTPFTVKDLKIKMQYKKNGKWQLCMDVKTLKSTLESLVMHHCIELIEPTSEQCKKKKVTYDDTRIKIKRGMRELNDRYIEIYYSAARAFIAKQITQREFKVFLCIVNNIKEGKSCTMEELDRILCIGKSHVVEAINNLKKAQCIDVIQRRSEKGNWYNIYSQKHTDTHNEETVNDLEVNVDIPNKKITSIEERYKDKEELIVKLLA